MDRSQVIYNICFRSGIWIHYFEKHLLTVDSSILLKQFPFYTTFWSIQIYVQNVYLLVQWDVHKVNQSKIGILAYAFCHCWHEIIGLKKPEYNLLNWTIVETSSEMPTKVIWDCDANGYATTITDWRDSLRRHCYVIYYYTTLFITYANKLSWCIDVHKFVISKWSFTSILPKKTAVTNIAPVLVLAIATLCW